MRGLEGRRGRRGVLRRFPMIPYPIRSRCQLTENYGLRRVKANFQKAVYFCNARKMDNAYALVVYEEN